MANEITISASLGVAAGSMNISQSTTKQATPTTPGAVQRRQTVPTADTVLTLTGVTTPRAVHITNMDSTNYIDIGPTSAGAIVEMVRLLAGETCVFPLKPSTVLRGKANTAGVVIEMLIAES